VLLTRRGPGHQVPEALANLKCTRFIHVAWHYTNDNFLGLIGLHEIVIWKVDMNLGDISTRTNVWERCSQDKRCQRSMPTAWNLLNRVTLKLIAWIEREVRENKEVWPE
jgi:hypothetical protein